MCGCTWVSDWMSGWMSTWVNEWVCMWVHVSVPCLVFHNISWHGMAYFYFISASCTNNCNPMYYFIWVAKIRCKLYFGVPFYNTLYHTHEHALTHTHVCVKNLSKILKENYYFWKQLIFKTLVIYILSVLYR